MAVLVLLKLRFLSKQFIIMNKILFLMILVALSPINTKAVAISQGGIGTLQASFSNIQQLSKQPADSITIKGRFVWKDKSITGYPNHVKISSTTKPEEQLIQKVDSLGNFEQKLAFGKYILSAELNYHWMGEELVRIDPEKSTKEIEIHAGSKPDVIIQLDTIPWPQKPVGEGILKSNDDIDFIGIDEFMRERMAFFEIPGAQLSLIKDHQIIYSQNYGVTNIEVPQPVISQSLFEAGSITKLVFAFAVMRLYERDLIDLDKPLHEYLPSSEIDDERYKLMTTRHVLSHQSGMSNWPRKDENGKFKLNFAPGTQFGYSGKAFEYLKEVIESISSKSIDVILQEEVLAPLEIEDMHFKGNEQIAQYGVNGHKKYIPSEVFMAKRTMAAYTLQTTSEALAKFASALHKREGLRKETYEEWFKVHSERADGTKWGLGVRIEESASGISYGHSGSTGRGFISNLVFYDESGLGFVVLTNSQMGGWLSLPLLNEYLILGNPN